MTSSKTRVTIGALAKDFATSATAHGLRRIFETRSSFGKLLWIFIFLSALAGCTYHCSFLIRKYLSFGKVTSTEEIHAKELDFPALTVCNLNIVKKQFLEEQLEKNKNTTHERLKGFCFESEETFLNRSNAKDLSDIWENLGVTLDHLKWYGHQVYDLIVQCTYNAKDCFNRSITKDLPLKTENITISDYPSTRLGYCHTIKLNETTLGLTLTLNIERDDYWDLLSPEFGVRLLIHPREAYPTLDRGGIVLHPGTKTYISIRIREIQRLPAPYGDCTTTFRDSPLASLLKHRDEDFLKYHYYYTYEFCQTLCRESLLLQECHCVEEQINSTHKFCNPCNKAEEDCKDEFKKRFDDNDTNACTQLCRPACEDTRYDFTLSTSEWPNIEFQDFVLKRWPELRSDFTEGNSSGSVNETYLNKNFLRVHVFIQEMNYLRFKDVEAYSLPELFADLGGCLGLYIGVSLISIIEFHELILHIMTIFYKNLNRSFQVDSSKGSRGHERRSRSRSVQRVISLPNRNYDHFRPQAPTPTVYFLHGRREKKAMQDIFRVANIESL
ncbi:degenerin deg-1-like [Uloborus diversus]|uniref:degenerin deg-1-like n=1 Tax=Uloborus diversus TaxID=327109 RepID=UPI002408FA3B|nr:degenerin deg-1-like [Uloborus diversus]